MELWQAIHFVRIEDLTSVARHAEELGFAGVAFGDHLVLPARRDSPYPYSDDGTVDLPSRAPFPDPWVATAAMAMATSTLRFLTDVYVLPLRDPFTVAKSVATASLLSQGRTELGVGVGWLEEEFAAVGIDFRTRGRRTDEMLAIMKALWAGKPVTYPGEFYQLDEIEVAPAPSQPVRVWVGGHSEAALRRAARLDGWIALQLPRQELQRLLARLQVFLQSEGRTSDGFEIMTAMGSDFQAHDYRELRDRGVTAVVAPPQRLETSISDWKSAMERTAEKFLAVEGDAADDGRQ